MPNGNEARTLIRAGFDPVGAGQHAPRAQLRPKLVDQMLRWSFGRTEQPRGSAPRDLAAGFRPQQMPEAASRRDPSQRSSQQEDSLPALAARAVGRPGGQKGGLSTPSNLTKIPWNSREAAAAIWLPWTERQACGSVSAARYPSPPRPFAFRALPLQKVGAVGSRPFTRGRGSWAQTQAGRLGQGQPGVPAAAGHRCW